MPIIVAANPKGGSGKSTSSLILGTTLARKGAKVLIIDADPQATILSWAKGESKYRELVAGPVPNEDLVDQIDRVSNDYQFIIIDVQGSANQELVSAMSRADLVMVPMRGKTADAEVATRAISLLRRQERLFKRQIPYGVLFVATNPAIRTREEKEIREDIQKSNVHCFETSLHERTAYSNMFRFKLALDELPREETNGLDAALQNAEVFASEIVHLLRKHREEVA
jgi:chromosome partitioning protein